MLSHTPAPLRHRELEIQSDLHSWGKPLRWCTAAVALIQCLTLARGAVGQRRKIHGVEGTSLNHLCKIQPLLASQSRFLDVAVIRSGL